MRSRRFAFTLPALALALALPATVLAGSDKDGTQGRAKTIEVNAPSSDKYLQFHGRIFITSGKTTTEYRWGGTSCGSRTMTPEMVALLVDVVRDREEIIVTPTYQDGQGANTKCLVGFSLKHKESGGKGGKPQPS